MTNKFQTIIDRVKSGEMSRSDLANLKINAEAKFSSGEKDAEQVLFAINYSRPIDTFILFMGFCPNADFDNRLDIEWKEKGICRFDYLESEHQVERFNSICTGDLIALKKREKFGKTMKLYGHGRVQGAAYDENNIRYLKVNWSDQNEVIEVPLMGCNTTVDIKSIETVEAEMPDEFFTWLRHKDQILKA